MKKIAFLTLAEVVEIHSDQIQHYGGSEGIRDMNLLSSEVAIPYVSLSGRFLHSDLYKMAGAYSFHISQNHPFVNGNKRTALAAGLVFLEMNGVTIADPGGKLYDAMVNLASGSLSKTGFAEVLRSLIS